MEANDSGDGGGDLDACPGVHEVAAGAVGEKNRSGFSQQLHLPPHPPVWRRLLRRRAQGAPAGLPQLRDAVICDLRPPGHRQVQGVQHRFRRGHLFLQEARGRRSCEAAGGRQEEFEVEAE